MGTSDHEKDHVLDGGHDDLNVDPDAADDDGDGDGW